jgi:hypothetical protein
MATLGAVVAGALIVYPLKSIAPVVSLGVVYLPAILLISIVWGCAWVSSPRSPTRSPSTTSSCLRCTAIAAA